MSILLNGALRIEIEQIRKYIFYKFQYLIQIFIVFSFRKAQLRRKNFLTSTQYRE